MAGINLSQSIKEKQALAQGNFFDRGFFINVAIFVVVLGLYGGSYWYLGTFEAKFTSLQAELVQRKVAMKNNQSNAVTDFHVRLAAIGTGVRANPDPRDALGELEQLTLPMIRVTEYQRSQSGTTGAALGIQGVTTNLRYLAQQMLAYKQAAGVTSVHVQSVKYNDAGQIEFELELPLTATPLENAS
ncbi:MAG: hypothetical protein WAT84_03115 [Candidatus Moraniibacteriota bacterium]